MKRHLTIFRKNLGTCRRLFALCLGEDPLLLPGVLPLKRVLSDWRRFRALNAIPSMRAEFVSLSPILDEFNAQAGDVTEYLHQDLWAARKIFAARPNRHVDIGSRIDGFVAHLLVFMPVEYVDIRPLDTPIKGLTTIVMDATSLASFPDNSIASLSSLSVAEHFGLGRYADPVDPMACFEFMVALSRVLAPGGRLYFSVPLGRERVEFNSHRVFAFSTILLHFRGLALESFSYIDERECLYENVGPDYECVASETGYGTGLFEFSKIVSQ